MTLLQAHDLWSNSAHLVDNFHFTSCFIVVPQFAQKCSLIPLSTNSITTPHCKWWWNIQHNHTNLLRVCIAAILIMFSLIGYVLCTYVRKLPMYVIGWFSLYIHIYMSWYMYMYIYACIDTCIIWFISNHIHFYIFITMNIYIYIYICCIHVLYQWPIMTLPPLPPGADPAAQRGFLRGGAPERPRGAAAADGVAGALQLFDRGQKNDPGGMGWVP